MTPWFAAATGFVIAASLWLYSPHPQLVFPAIAIGKVPCSSSGCTSHADRHGGGRLANSSGQPVTQQKSGAPARTDTPGRAATAAAGLTFGYFARRTEPAYFELIVSVTGKRAIKNWTLAFVLPGDHIRSVFGAHWRPSGSDGGIASSFTGPGQDGRGDYGRGDYGYGRGGATDQFGVSFTVVASGTRVIPDGCRFDGASCAFRALSSASQGRP